jgi:hypothetical protein
VDHHTIIAAPAATGAPRSSRTSSSSKASAIPLRQIAIRNIGRDEPTLLITNDLTAPAKDLFARYAERMIIENELDAYISGSTSTPCPQGSPQRRPRHHPHRGGRQLLPAFGQNLAAL